MNKRTSKRWTVPLLLGAAVLLFAVEAQTQRRPREAPVRFPQDNIPERRPTPESAREDLRPATKKAEAKAEDGPGIWETIRGTLGECTGVVTGWHRKLSEHMPEEAAWGVVAAPAWLFLLLLLSIARRRRRPRPQKAVAKTKQRSPKPAPARQASSVADDAPTGRPPTEKRKVDDIPPLTHSPAEQVLLSTDEERASFHEAFVVMGADEHAVQALRIACRDAIDEPTWSAAVKNNKVELLRPVRERWVKALSAMRVKAWLESDPLVSEPKLLVGMPDLHEVSELGSVILTQPSGLGADLNEAQEALLQQARWALQQTWQNPLPHTLMVVARRTKVAALVGDPNIDSYALALALHGTEAHEHGHQTQGNPSGLGDEFREALAEHRKLVDTPVGGEGCAVHALKAIGGGRQDGVGTICASMAGAAFSPAAVNLRISKFVGDLSDVEKQSCGRLGKLVHGLLGDSKSNDGAALLSNLRRVLGHELLKAAAKRAEEVAGRTRKLAKKPIWPDSQGETPDQVLVGLQNTLISHAQRQTAAAKTRLFSIFDKLGYAGSTGESQALGMQRLGYAVACFGMALLRSTSTELLSAGREVVGELGKGGG